MNAPSANGGSQSVEELVFEMTFESEEQALAKHAWLDAFVGGTVTSIVDEVLGDHSVPGSVLAIDLIEIDLGSFASESFLAEAPARFRELLTRALAELGPSGSAAIQGDSRLLSSEEYDFQLLAGFLACGRFPWSNVVTSSHTLEALLSRVVERDVALLADFLRRTPSQQNAIRRLAEQFPAQLVDTAILRMAALGPAPIAAVVELVRRLFLTQGPNSRCGSLPEPLVRSLQLKLLLTRGHCTSAKEAVMQALSAVAPSAVGDTDAFVALLQRHENRIAHFTAAAPQVLPNDRSGLRALVAEVLVTGVVASIAGVWGELVRDEASLMRETIKRFGAETTVRRSMATRFPDPMLRDVVFLFEPLEHSFVEEIVDRPEIFQEVARKRREEAEGVKARLWEFTLTYLLVERGSEFNRQSYLGSVLRQMAAHSNMSHRELLLSLKEVLAGMEWPSALKEELLDLLLRIAASEGIGGAAGDRAFAGEDEGTGREVLPQFPAAEMKQPGAPGGELLTDGLRLQEHQNRHSNPERNRLATEAGEPGADLVADAPAEARFLIAALCSALSKSDRNQVEKLWPKLRKEPTVLRRVIRSYGQSATGRRRIAASFPETLLVDLLNLLRAAEGPFIFAVATRLLPLAAGRDLPDVKGGVTGTHWMEWTLEYLLADRGNSFSRESYLTYMLGQLSGLAGIAPEAAIRSVANAAGEVLVPATVKRDITALLEKIAAGKPGGHESSEKAQQDQDRAKWRVRFSALLTQNDMTALQRSWPELHRQDPELLKLTLRQCGADAVVRRRMAHGLSEPVLMDVLYLLEPREGVFIEELVSHPQSIPSDALPGTLGPEGVSRHLWDFTLTYLLVERGSDFNRKSYLKSVVRQMAAHSNLHYHDLLLSFRHSLSGMTAWGGLRTEMLTLVEGIAHEEGAAPCDAPGHPGGGGKLLRGYDLAGRLRSHLSESGSAGATAGTEVAQLCEELAREHPARFLLLLNELAAEPETRGAGWSPSLPTIEAVLEAYLRLARPEVDLQLFFAALRRIFDGAVRLLSFQEILKLLLTRSEADAVSLLQEIRVKAHATEPGGNVRPLPNDRREIPGRDADLRARVGWAPRAHADIAPVNRWAEDCPPYFIPGSSRKTLSNGGQGGFALGSDLPKSSLSSAPAVWNIADGTEGYAEEVLLRVIEGGAPVTEAEAAVLRQAVSLLLDHRPVQFRRMLERLLQRKDNTALLVAVLQESLLARVLFLLQPAAYAGLQQMADLLARGVYRMTGYTGGLAITRLKWEFMLHTFAVGVSLQDKEFVAAFTALLAAEAGYADSSDFNIELRRQMALSSKEGCFMKSIRVVELLSSDITAAPAASKSPAPDEPPPSWQWRVEEMDLSEPIYLMNAGQVLAGGYLPQLFDMLGLLHNGDFDDPSKAERAVHLIQFMVDARCAAPEHELVLNKILCGIDLDAPVVPRIEITDRERDTVESLLAGMIANWSALGTTSPQQFRSSFLQREGRLCLKDDAWDLLVQPQAYDLLLDRIPWSYSFHKFRWMKHPVRVDWRHGL